MDLRNATPLFRTAYKFSEKDTPQDRVRKLNEFARQVENRLNDLERRQNDSEEKIRAVAE